MKRKHPILHNILLYSVFIVYLIILCVILFRARHDIRTIKLVPFGTIIDFLSRDKVSHIFIISNLLGNVVLFVPLGIYLALFNQGENFKKNVFRVFLVSLFAEIIQVTFKIGVGDIDDIILNTLGGYIGIIIYRTLLLRFKDKNKVRNMIEIVALVGAIVSVPIWYCYRNRI